MAKNTTPYFHKGGQQATTTLTGSFADLVVGQADDSDVTELVVMNVSVSNVQVYVADENDSVLLNISIPTGTVKDLLADRELPGTLSDAFGNRFYRLLAGNKLRARASEASALKIRWTRMDF